MQPTDDASDAKPISVMLVDDHRTILWGLQQLIDSQQPRMHVVATASDPESAIGKAHQCKPDVIVLDIDLGEQNSLNLLPDLVRNEASLVLILTGVREKSLLEKAAVLGARGIVHKEDAPENLIKAIEHIVAGQLWLDRETTTRVFTALRKGSERRDEEARRIDLLTPKERTIVDALVHDCGAPNKVLAKKLCMSESTLRNHLSTIYGKLQVENRISLYVFVTRNGDGAVGRGAGQH